MFSKWGKIAILAISAAGLAFFSGCESKAQTGALIGAGAGAGIGQAVGGDTEATLIGAGIGGAAGYLLGDRQDKESDREQVYRNIDSDTVTVWVTNSNGSKTPVTLEKQGSGYVGPDGEYYETMPTEGELKNKYGF